MRVISLTGASSVPDQDGVEHEAGDDSVFDLPHEFAVHLTTKHASVWRVESEHEAAAQAAVVDELRNPHVLPGVVADLRRRLTAAEARIEELSGRISDATPVEDEPESDDAEDSPADVQESGDDSEDDSTPATASEDEQVDEPKPTRARKAPAKKTAAKPAAE